MGVCGPGKLPEAALIAAPYVPLCLFRNLSCVRGVPVSVNSVLSLTSGMKRSRACHKHCERSSCKQKHSHCNTSKGIMDMSVGCML